MRALKKMSQKIVRPIELLSIFRSFVYSVTAERETCALLQKGVAAIFGPQTLASLEHIRSITDVVEVPFIDTKWNMHPVDPVLTSDHRNQYTINLHPDVTTLGSAFIDLVITVSLLASATILLPIWIMIQNRPDHSPLSMTGASGNVRSK